VYSTCSKPSRVTCAPLLFCGEGESLSLSVNRVETPAFRQAVFNTALDLG
jgi:hypothetical protein